jgi:hypothetical protein
MGEVCGWKLWSERVTFQEDERGSVGRNATAQNSVIVARLAMIQRFLSRGTLERPPQIGTVSSQARWLRRVR